jgi:hypothetical protein
MEDEIGHPISGRNGELSEYHALNWVKHRKKV